MRGLLCNCNSNWINRCNCNCKSQAPRGIKTLVQVVLDSCHQCSEITMDVVIPAHRMPIHSGGPSHLPPIGTCIPINPAGPITCQEISRDCQCVNCQNVCLSTVLFNCPVQLHNPCNPCEATLYNLTSIQNFTLACTNNSQLDCLNTKVLSVKAIVTNVDCENITISINMLADIVVRQTTYKEIFLPGAYEPEKRICDSNGDPCSLINANDTGTKCCC